MAINSFTQCVFACAVVRVRVRVCAQFVVLHGQGVAVEDQVPRYPSCGTYNNLHVRSHRTGTVTNLALAYEKVMDRLMSSYGQNILGSLFWAVNQPANKVATPSRSICFW